MTITNHGMTARRVSVDRKGVRTASDTYKLEVTEGETLYQIGADSSVPQIGTLYSNDPSSWCVSVEVSLSDGKNGYEVTCSYSSEFEVSDNPLNEPARISWTGENFQQVAVVDIDDNPILNSAGDPYDPPLMKDFSRPVATIRKNISSAPAWILTSHDAINSDEFVIDGLTCEIGKAKLKRADISEWQYRNGIGYRELNLVIHFSKDGWTRKVLDAGFRRKYNDTERELITLTAEDGAQQYPPGPVPLDGSGVELTDPTPSTCVYNSHELDESIAFSALPLS
jgi:hypothetical protein